MKISLKRTEHAGRTRDRLRALRYLAAHTVDVGLAPGASGRSRQLLAIHEHGAPALRIPARPAVRPALSEPAVRAEMASALRKACSAAAEGDLPAAARAMAASGKTGADAVRARISAGIPPPNAPVTLRGGWIRNPVSGKPVKVKGKSGATPLVDTGQLYDDIGYEIREKTR